MRSHKIGDFKEFFIPVTSFQNSLTKIWHWNEVEGQRVQTTEIDNRDSKLQWWFIFTEFYSTSEMQFKVEDDGNLDWRPVDCKYLNLGGCFG